VKMIKLAKPEKRPWPNRVELSDYYIRDSREFFEKYIALRDSCDFDPRTPQGLRFKWSMDLLHSLECALKAAAALRKPHSCSGARLVEEIRGYNHNVRRLRKDVFHGFSEPNGWRGALDCAERLSVGYRYWLDAQFFREDNAELYYESVGNDHWHSATADIVQNINRRCAHVLTLVSPSIYTGDALRQELLRERWVPTTRA
jgi:hypothetical protein